MSAKCWVLSAEFRKAYALILLLRWLNTHFSFFTLFGIQFIVAGDQRSAPTFLFCILNYAFCIVKSNDITKPSRCVVTSFNLSLPWLCKRSFRHLSVCSFLSDECKVLSAEFRKAYALILLLRWTDTHFFIFCFLHISNFLLATLGLPFLIPNYALRIPN